MFGDAWNTNGQRLITSVAMRPCPNELKTLVCVLMLVKKNIENTTIIFPRYVRTRHITIKHKLVLCINSVRGWKCWERHNSDHIKVFHHKH